MPNACMGDFGTDPNRTCTQYVYKTNYPSGCINAASKIGGGSSGGNMNIYGQMYCNIPTNRYDYGTVPAIGFSESPEHTHNVSLVIGTEKEGRNNIMSVLFSPVDPSVANPPSFGVLYCKKN